MASTHEFFEQLDIRDVRVLKDKRKEEIVEEFESIKQIAEARGADCQILTIIVRWIGWDVDMTRKTEKNVF